MNTTREDTIRKVAAESGFEQAIAAAVESQFQRLEIRAIFPEVTLPEIIRAWVLCFQAPLRKPGSPCRQWVLMEVSELLYSEGEFEIEGLTLQAIFDWVGPHRRPSWPSLVA